MKLATANQMRAMDRRAIEEFGIPGVVLMENAAIRIADEIARRYGLGKTFAAVCGPGNNGGDGLAVARHLTGRYEWSGTAWLCAEPSSKTTPDHDLNLNIVRKSQIAVRQSTEPEFADEIGRADVVIDALLGTGASGEPRPAFAAAIRAINERAGGRIVAVDLPSGVDADTGAAGSPTIDAVVTVTLGLSKIGLHLSPASDHVGDLVVGDLCYPPQIISGENPAPEVILTDRRDIAGWLPVREQRRDTNKGTYGAVALFAGSQGFAGAPTLCCLGAARAGAGLVTLGVPEGLIDVMMARLPDVVMARGFLDTGGRQFRHAAVGEALKFVDKMDAVGFGPGIGTEGTEIENFVRDFIAQCPKSMVIDADALNCLSKQPDHGAAILRARAAPTILTPHPGEMGRLMDFSTKEVQADRLGTVRRAAETFGCVVLLKGDRTLIASPDGRLAINTTGNAGMASGGMGDTLTGIATTLLAQINDGDAFHAAAASAYIHGLAGDLAASRIGKAGLMATDLGDHLPEAIRLCQEDG